MKKWQLCQCSFELHIIFTCCIVCSYQFNRVCQCSFELHIIFTNLSSAGLSFSRRVSMLFRASHHFHWLRKDEVRVLCSVSMLFRASHHFHPTPSETLDLQGFLRPVLQVFFWIFWQIAFFRVFLCLGKIFPVFQLFFDIFQFSLKFIFSPFSPL